MTITDVIQANWLIFVAALLVAVLVAWWLFGRGGKPQVRERRPDVLDEGAAPAQRNQALIDAPPAAAFQAPPITPPPAAGVFAGIGEVIAHGAEEEVEAAQAQALEEPQPATSEAGEPDDLRRIKGIGPKLVTTLHALGVTRYAQIAAWTDADLDALDPQLGAFAGRPRRDSWVEQAKLLESGDTGAYEARFGKL
jgi:predicted flap endonuclease-1-like 5' DNA nuclease